MPTDESLDAMAIKIAGVRFSLLGPDHKALIMKLAILADMSADTQLLTEHLAVCAQNLESIDNFMRDEESGFGTLGADLHHVGRWFEMSRLFDGIPT
jgi:hypothetical protein